MRKIQQGGVLDTLKTLAARPEGVTSPELAKVCGMDVGRASARLNKNMQRKHVYRSQRVGYILHWFDTAERAQEWAALPPMHKPELTAPVRKPIQTKALGIDKKASQSPSSFTAGASKLKTFKADDSAIESGQYKFSDEFQGIELVESGKDFRHTVRPEEVKPVFSGLGIGRYLEVRA